MRVRRMPWVFLLVGSIVACQRRPLDTTKHVYEDWEVPEHQIYIVNGKETRIPWKEVPESRRWMSEVADEESWWPGRRYKSRVPIAKVEILTHDKDGNPVEPDKAFDGRMFYTGVNPDHWSCAILGERH